MRTSTEVHDGVGIAFDHTKVILRLVLMLMVGLRLILGDEKSSDNISSHLGNFILATISDESIDGTTLANVVRQKVHKLHEVIDIIAITSQSVLSTRELGHGGVIINGWYVTHDSVSGDGFIAVRNVEDRIMGLEMFLEVITGSNHYSITRGDMKWP